LLEVRRHRADWPPTDLALSMIEEDHGVELAAQVARQLVVFLRRSSTQPQFSATLKSQTAEKRSLRELQPWLADNLNGDLSVEALAKLVEMSSSAGVQPVHPPGR